MLVNTVYLVAILTFMVLPFAGLGWLLARLIGWQSGRQGLRAITWTSLGISAFLGAMMMIGAVPEPDGVVDAKRQQEERKIAARQARECENHTGAFVASRQFVKSRLRSPGSADFPFLDFEHRLLGGCQIAIRSYVDSQNGFGALVRTHYRAVVKREENSWALISLQFE